MNRRRPSSYTRTFEYNPCAPSGATHKTWKLEPRGINTQNPLPSPTQPASKEDNNTHSIAYAMCGTLVLVLGVALLLYLAIRLFKQKRRREGQQVEGIRGQVYDARAARLAQMQEQAVVPAPDYAAATATNDDSLPSYEVSTGEVMRRGQ
ncbi:hypothetical protein E4U34_004883 [Claviceps purpurea]|nr:hypothetical protein E4U51_000062 [Claviceps purpurea]KAG6231386.1 hypothetical protein E4U34_004883 [Claviceps purpurea]KAG6283688.1 hypothetical protein E4U48_007225 [Claviceps purpurea]